MRRKAKVEKVEKLKKEERKEEESGKKERSCGSGCDGYRTRLSS